MVNRVEVTMEAKFSAELLPQALRRVTNQLKHVANCTGLPWCIVIATPANNIVMHGAPEQAAPKAVTA